METFISVSEHQTIEFGEKFSQRLKPSDIVFLQGDLGGGKTTFAKGIAKGLGVGSRIISPTFVVARSHDAKNSFGIAKMYHLDLYRLEDSKQVKDIDLHEYLDDQAGVVVIEWPEIGQDIVNGKAWKVNFEPLGEEERKITITHE